jgi:hypothetical protein
MTLTTTTTSQNASIVDGAVTVGIVLIVTLGYALACWLKPYTACHRCGGTGHTETSALRRWLGHGAERPCRRCKATGLRLRLGRRIANHLTRARREANQ